MNLDQIAYVITHPRFCGLWSYKPQKQKRRYCCTVIINFQASETRMFDEWIDAVKEAGEMIHKEAVFGQRTISAGS